MRLFVTPVTPLRQNCSILACDETAEAAVVDPGGELDRVLARVDHEGLKLTKILITHGHIDHAGATARLARRLDLPIEGPHPADRFWIEQLALQASRFRYIPVLSEPQGSWTGRRGWVHEAVLEDFGTLSGFDIYASGPPAMIAAVRREFALRGADPARLFFDSFDYAPDALDRQRTSAATKS